MTSSARTEQVARVALVTAGLSASGGIVGALSPLLGFGLLRRVPLGRAILVTAVGTVVGAIGGELLNPLNPYAHTIPGVIGGAFAGFLVAGAALRIANRRAHSSPVAPGA